MSTLVFQECHFWLNLAEMMEANKVRFLDSHTSQASLFGNTVNDFAQQFCQPITEGILQRHLHPLQCGLSSRHHPGCTVEPPAGR